MNCSEWNNISIDHLDGFLKGQAQREADAHIEGCTKCRERLSHFIGLSNSINQIPRNPLPLALKRTNLKSNFFDEITRFDFRKIHNHWLKAPWYFRATAEASGILALVLLIVWFIPMVRESYEKRVEKQLDALQLEQLAYDYKKAGESDEHAHAPLERAQSNTESTALMGTEGDTDDDTEVTKASKGQIWRFILRTDTPKEVRPKIIQALLDLKIPKETPKIGGVEAPGGIQFDLLIPTELTVELKSKLDKLSETVSAPTNLPAGTDILTWYKLKSKTPIPAGKTRIIIWISQI